MKDVLINVKGCQDFDGISDGSELTALGRLGLKDGKVLITYSESEIIGATGVKTLMQIDGNKKVVLKRTGAVNNKLIIESGKHNECFYSTPEGHFVLGIYGDSISNNINEHGGKLIMKYSVDINTGLLSRNSIEINIKEVQNNVGIC